MFKKSQRRAQGLSWNVMILAIIALIVLVVIISIFSRQTGRSVNTLESCGGRGGDCRSGNCLLNEFKYGDKDLCSESKPNCCIKVFDDKKNK